jgi:hypothetical protein
MIYFKTTTNGKQSTKNSENKKIKIVFNSHLKLHSNVGIQILRVVQTGRSSILHTDFSSFFTNSPSLLYFYEYL